MSSHALAHRGRFIGLVIAGLFFRAGIAFCDDDSPRVDERQLPFAMHSRMSELPKIRVGQRDADINGTDHRALQAAVDYVASLGGGVVEIGAGEYQMGDSLHLRSNVTVRGQKGKTVLRKADAASSPLALDGDFGEQQVTLKNPSGFAVGSGITVWDDHGNGFHTTVGRITGRNKNTFSIDNPFIADYMTAAHATASTVFPVVAGCEVHSARVEDLIIEGNKGANPLLNGCRGAGIYFYGGHGAVIQGCVVRNFHGDGISFQQSNDVTVKDCVCEDNTHLGLHPGSGSQRPVVHDCVARRNGGDGLFLCWRVRHGVFERNRLEENGDAGISIGHKDSDNLLRDNLVARNGSCGVLFREEAEGMSPHRNRLERNSIQDNGRKPGAAGIRIRGEPDGLVFEGNLIRDAREVTKQTQTIGVLIEARVGSVRLEGNDIKGSLPVDDRRVATAGRQP